MFEEPLKNLKDGPKVCTFGQTLNPCYPLKMAEIEKDKYLLDKTLTTGLSKYVKIKTVFFLLFTGKIQLLLAQFFGRKQSGVTCSRVGIKI